MWLAEVIPYGCARHCIHGRPDLATGECTHPDANTRKRSNMSTVEEARAKGAACGPDAHLMEFRLDKPHTPAPGPHAYATPRTIGR